MYVSPHLEGLKDEYLDVNFSRDYPPELLGCNDPTSQQQELYRGYGVPYGSVMPVYTRAQVIDHIKRMDEADAWRTRRLRFKKNQGREGSCVYNMAAHIVQIAQAVHWGDHNVVALSPISGYRFNARGPNTGSTVGGAIKWLETKGLIPTNNAENIAKFRHTHPDTGYYVQPPAGWETTAAEFCADEWMYITTVEEWWSAIINGHACGGGRNGHAIAHAALGLSGRSILSIYIQSWYMPWGFAMDTADGRLTTFGADTEARVQTMVRRDGWAIRTLRKPTYNLAS